MFTFISFILFLFFSTLIHGCDIQEVTMEEIPKLIETTCVFVATSTNNSAIIPVLQKLTKVFAKEQIVKIGILKPEKSYYSKSQEYGINTASITKKKDTDFLLFPRKITDRKCLLQPPRTNLKEETYKGALDTELILQFINEKCKTFRNIQGTLNHAGRMRDFILKNLYSVRKDDADGDKIRNEDFGQVDVGANCERIRMPSREEFIHKYLFRSKPVIITDAMQSWPALSKWTNEFLISKFGKNTVRVAFAPNSEYEGCEKASDFEDYKTFKLPEEVKEKLPFPDLVVVRPAFLEMKFEKFMDLLNKTAKPNKTTGDNVSAYLEYSSIPTHLPELERDIKEMPFIAGVLERKHLNIWLSNGNTLGKLHFDPFDNFLCQVSGKKEVILYEPHDNTRLYEAHIQEAELGYEPNSMKFRRKKLMDSTSMVMSPVNILKPDYKRFPKFKEVKAMNCTINEGDVLYMPSFWWHEVQSYPSQQAPRNVAVNFWYEPFLDKEYPCETCQLDINPHYYSILYK